jgi:GDP-4-dehydro-6-deoxy-D-mannose reductase
MKSLIVGITSCSGSYLAEHLLMKNFKVLGTKRKTSSLNNIRHILDKIKLFDIDFNDRESIAGVLEQSKPHYIFFLAAANQFYNLEDIYKTNVEGTINFFEALIKISCKTRIVLVSSSAVYGVRTDYYPLKETDKLLPSSHYGLSKVFQETIASHYSRNYDLDVVIARPFNFTGPREYPSYVCSDFAKQIVDIEKGKKEPIIKVGNLENKRDFTDVRDIVKGYELLAVRGIRGEVYNLCSGRVFSIKQILDKLLSMSTVDIKIRVEPNKIKEMKTNIQVGDNSKIFSLCGWKPQIPLEKTLENILNYYRKI